MKNTFFNTKSILSLCYCVIAVIKLPVVVILVIKACCCLFLHNSSSSVSTAGFGGVFARASNAAVNCATTVDSAILPFFISSSSEIITSAFLLVGYNEDTAAGDLVHEFSNPDSRLISNS